MASVPGEIRADSAYTIPEVCARLGMARAAWRALRAKGLPVAKIGRRGYVLGADVLKVLREVAA